MKNGLIILIFIGLLVSCENKHDKDQADNLNGIWLGASVRLDPGVYRPINQILEIDSSGVNLWNGDNDDPFMYFQVRNDSIKIGNAIKPIHEFKRFKDVLEIGDFQPFVYHMLNPYPLEINNDQIASNLVNENWENTEEYLEFFEDSLLIYNHNERTKEKICWSLEDFRNLKFIQKKGSFASCEYPNRGIDYITRISENQLEVFRIVNEQLVKKTYKITKDSPPDYAYPSFRLCNPYIYRNSFADRYPFKYTNFEGGLYRLKQIFDKHYNPVGSGVNSGLIRIGFVINCVGEIGNFDVLELNNDYKKIKMNPSISKQLINILNEQQKWNPGTWYDREIDTYKFLSFRMHEGRIVDIFP